ncbi:MAG: hypothetical protein AAFZ38_01125 [Myxococcota bacterium]
MRSWLAAFLLLGAIGCGHSSKVSPVRFALAEPVWAVDDQRDVAEKPSDNVFAQKLYFTDQLLYGRVDDSMRLLKDRRAMNVNSRGGVPDSSWWTNRIGLRELSAEDIKRGPNQYPDGPSTQEPWTVTGGKVGGRAPGFIIEDARGDRYVIKLDPAGKPAIETSTDVIVQRLLHAFGYHVPENSVVTFTREQLYLASGATQEDPFGNKEPMGENDLDEILARGARRDARYRALASRYVPGIPLGGFPQEGVRDDDPNDVVPHEHRREVRAIGVVYNWLLHTDVKEDNTLDVYVTDENGRRFVRHYMLDFGHGLGANGLLGQRYGDGYLEYFDWEYFSKSLFALGFYVRPWEGYEVPNHPGVGLFLIERYKPWKWRPQAPYFPIRFLDRFDTYWASKIILAFSKEHLRAAVEAGELGDPRSENYLVETLHGRARVLARWAFEQVNPLDEFEIDPSGRLCFSDLLLAHGLGSASSSTRYRAVAFDENGRLSGSSTIQNASEAGRACAEKALKDALPYQIISVQTLRGDLALGPVEVHIARVEGAHRIVGIHRQ